MRTAGSVSDSDSFDADKKDCLGIAKTGTSYPDYDKVLKSRHDGASVSVRKVFDKYSKKLNIQTSDYPRDLTPHYAPLENPYHRRGVYYNSYEDTKNPRGAGSTYYHELAHMIDHAAGKFKGNISDTSDFRQALYNDGNRVLSMYSQLSADRKLLFKSKINSDAAHSLSDLLDVTTNGQLYGRYGHSQKYWLRPGNLEAEAFAHFFEASMGCSTKRDMLKNFFPTAFAIFEQKIQSIS